MACRVGITTDPGGREQDWRSRYPRTFKNWQIVGGPYPRWQAQMEENRLANLWGCESHHGGREPKLARLWYVYKFEY